MEPSLIGYISIGLLLLLLAMGVHVAIALGLLGFLGYIGIMGLKGALGQLTSISYGVVSQYEFSVCPLFLLMGMFAFHAGLGTGLFKAAQAWLGKLPGGLAVATNVAAGAFGAASGSTLASAAIFTRVALPEMLRYGYQRPLAAGTIACAGTYASMIPPSVLMILYGIFTDTSIAALFIAGIIPGIVTVILFAIMIITRVKLNPQLAPRVEISITWRQRLSAMSGTWPLMALIILVLGGIYGGFFSATEAGAVGAFGALIIAIIQVGIREIHLGEALAEAARTTAMIFAIIIGAILYSRFLAITQVPAEMSDFLGGLAAPPFVIMLGFMVMYILLGCVLDAIGMMAVTIPVVFPVVVGLGYDPVWFGVFVIVMMEMAMVTPPLGLSTYVCKAAAGELVTLEEIFKGIIPFIVIELIVVGLLLSWPQLALWLPGLMRG